jgi:sugar lactone lactonase YvrE
VGPDLLCANGIVIADDGRTLRVAETFGDRITAFDLGEDGSLSGQRVWASLPAGHAPDGICLDAEGGSWVACPFAQRFVRIAANGAVTDRIPVPGRNAIACTLGGETGATLFMITWEPTGESHADTEARTSRVEATEVGIPTGGQP